MFSAITRGFLLTLIFDTISVLAEPPDKLNLILDFLRSEQKFKSINIIGDPNPDFLFDLLQDLEKPLSIHYTSLPSKLNMTERLWAHQTLLVLDFDKTPSLFEDFRKMEKSFLEHPFHWLIFVKEEQVTVFGSLYITIGSDIILALRNAETDHFELVQGKTNWSVFITNLFNDLLNHIVYKVRPETNRTHEEGYGHWNNSSGLVDTRSTKIICNRRKNLRNENLIISAAFITNATYEYIYNSK